MKSLNGNNVLVAGGVNLLVFLSVVSFFPMNSDVTLYDGSSSGKLRGMTENDLWGQILGIEVEGSFLTKLDDCSEDLGLIFPLGSSSKCPLLNGIPHRKLPDEPLDSLNTVGNLEKQV